MPRLPPAKGTIAALEKLEQLVEAARARQNLAITYFEQGRYNEALTLLDEVRNVPLADGRRRDVILLDVFTSDCLLQLRRFADVLAKCCVARSISQAGARFEGAQALLNEAAAYAGLGDFTQALASLDEARRMFEEESNAVWVAHATCTGQLLLQRQGRLDESLGGRSLRASFAAITSCRSQRRRRT